jgi:hypothetical protein
MLMREVAYRPVADVDSAIAALGAHENAMLLAGAPMWWITCGPA